MAGIFPKNACSAIIYYWPIDFYPSRVDLPTVSEKGAENVPNQPLRRECSATRDFFDPQDIDKVGYFERGAKHGLALTHYRVSEKRGAVLTTLEGGVIVHDHFKPYFTLKDVAHA